MSVMASQITGVMIVYSTVCSGADERKHQSSKSLAFARGIHRWPVNSPHNEPVMWKMFPFDITMDLGEHWLRGWWKQDNIWTNIDFSLVMIKILDPATFQPNLQLMMMRILWGCANWTILHRGVTLRSIQQYNPSGIVLPIYRTYLISYQISLAQWHT